MPKFSIVTIIKHFFPRESENLSEVLESGNYKGTSLSPSKNYVEEIVSGAVIAMEQRFELKNDDKNITDCTKILNLKAWPVEDTNFGGYKLFKCCNVC